MNNNLTAQEKLWKGEFGDDYIARNISNEWISSNARFFAEILSKTQSVNSIFEIGTNIGLNIRAIKLLLSHAKVSGVEINRKACDIVNKDTNDTVNIHNMSITEYEVNEKYDFVFTKGVLIHINPSLLQDVYEKMYNLSNKYIMVAEYYNPSPVVINYRGKEDSLFKRDFCGEIMDKYDDLKLIDYGFAYHRDNNFKQDDITWFLLEKK